MQEQPKPVFYVKTIQSLNRCDCGKNAVTLQILTPQGDKLNRCETCLKKLKYTFQGAEFIPTKILNSKLKKLSASAKNDKKQAKFSQNRLISSKQNSWI